MHADLDSIACFVAAAKTLNFRQAARSVALTPAALGKRISQLEDVIENRLFERTTRRVSLTPAGSAMLPLALKLMELADECIRAGRGAAGPAPTTIKMGTRHELGMSWLHPMMTFLEHALPNVHIDLYFGSGPDLEERVKRFHIDCAVTSRVFVDPVFDSLRLVREDYAFVGSPKLLASMPLTTPEDAETHTLLDVQPERPLYRYFHDAEDAPDRMRFGRLRIQGTTAAIRQSVLDGFGVAVLPLYLVEEDLHRGRLSTLFPKVRPLFDYFRLVYRHDDPKVALYQSLSELMRTQPLS